MQTALRARSSEARWQRRRSGAWLARAALAAALTLVAPRSRADDASPSWATSQAAELTRQGRDHFAHGEPAVALRRYLDAIAFDATFGPAYLALGALYEATGDSPQAEQAYAIGLEHVAGFPDAHLARARLRIRLHRLPEAMTDLEAAVAQRPDDLDLIAELARGYVATGNLPAALAATRRLAASAAAQVDSKVFAAARLQAVALGRLVAEVDPVGAGLRGRGPVRHALALVARRR